jgi:hypothetical protein
MRIRARKEDVHGERLVPSRTKRLADGCGGGGLFAIDGNDSEWIWKA